MALTLGVSGVAAQRIQPSGKKIGRDEHGHAIFQVQANGIEIGCKLIGSGEPLVMIIGLGQTMEQWPQEIVETLADQYQLILLDNRGMGHTTANDATFSVKLFAEDVMALLDALQVKKAHVLGYSMGSTTVQRLLLEYPQRFNKAIIHATSTDGSQVARNVAKAMKGKVPDNSTVQRQIEATTHWRTPLDKLPSIPNPVMLVVGTADAVVGVKSSKTLASAIPGAWLVQFKNATHFLMYEAPSEFARIVLTFLETDATVRPK